MRNILIKILTFSLLLFAFSNASSQEVVKGLKQVFDVTIDDLGNAEIEVSMKLNASQWDMYKRYLGNNTSVLKRQMERGLPKYYITDFKYTEDQMERSYKMNFKVLGMGFLNENGTWESSLDAKDPDITKLSDREFVMNVDMMSNGNFIQQTQKIHLPANASDAKIEKDSFGNAVLTYSTGNMLQSNWMMFAGIALMLGGGGLYFKNRNPSRSKLKVVKEEAKLEKIA
jgi:LPXTG-motif cell wall-anchored protein